MSAPSGFLRRHSLALKVWGAIAVLIAAWVWGSPKWLATFMLDEVSPQGYYRVAFWRAFYLSSIDYGFVRLYDNRTGTFID